MKTVVALLIFSIIILIHELGHFLLAKLNRITVKEFSLGMGPRLCSFIKGETRYSIKVLPFGGSCMMAGEDEEDAGEGTFGSKSVWARMSVIAAGPIFNFLLAFVLSVILVGIAGTDKPILMDVSEGGAAEAAGMQAGDVITKMNGKSIHVYRELSNYSMFHNGEPVLFEYIRDGEKYEAYVEPKMTQTGYKYGVIGGYYREKTGVFETLKYGAHEVGYWIDLTLQSLKMLLGGGVSIDQMSGPVGVVNAIGKTYEESKPDGALYVWLNMINIAILLTANLGVMNLLPIPALDGGRLLFLIVEAFRGRRISPELEAKIHLTGLALLMLLMVVIMFNDLKRIIF